MKNIFIGVLLGVLIGIGVYTVFVVKPNKIESENKHDIALKKAYIKIDSIILFTDTLISQSKAFEEKASSYALKEKDALKRAKIEHIKYLNLKKSIPKSLQECIDKSQMSEGHLLAELINADIAYSNCDSARISYVAALQKSKEIPNINTGINDIIEDMKNAFEKKLEIKNNELKAVNKKLTLQKILRWVQTIVAIGIGFVI